jgi:hypothetical protein
VEIGLDAFPEKKLKGIVTNVANVGEQRPNSDAKVFEATIEIQRSDDMLKPSMTTSNRIITSVLDSALYVPLECLHSKDDSISFVFVRKGIKKSKQEIQVGGTNNNEAVVNMGLEPGDRVYLSVPDGMEDEPIALLPELDGKRNIEEEPEVEEKPKERVITLPDGRKITVPADGGQGGMRRMRQGGQQNQDSNKTTGGSAGAEKVDGNQENTKSDDTSEEMKESPEEKSKESTSQDS